MPCINLFPTTACDAKNDNRKLNTIASYATKKFGIEYQGFLLRFCTHRNEFNCVFSSTKLHKYAIHSLIWSYGISYYTNGAINPWISKIDLSKCLEGIIHNLDGGKTDHNLNLPLVKASKELANLFSSFYQQSLENGIWKDEDDCIAIGLDKQNILA